MALIEITRDDDRYGHPTSVIPSKSCFVDPSGNFYALPYAGHDKFAETFYGVWASELEERGWLHISGGSIYTYNLPNCDIPQCQINTCFEIAQAYRAADCERIADRFESEFREIIMNVGSRDNYGLDY